MAPRQIHGWLCYVAHSTTATCLRGYEGTFRRVHTPTRHCTPPAPWLDDRRGSAVDVDGNAREVAGPLRGQEGYHISRLVGFADPA